MKKTRAKKVTLEALAGMVANGFDAQEKNITEKLTGEINGVESRLTEKINGVETRLETKINGVETRLSQQITGINNRIDDLALNRATREELLVLDKRVGRIETKLGLDFKRQAHA